jgi:hypothetical protein
MSNTHTTTLPSRWDDERGIWVGPEKINAAPKQSAMDRLREKRRQAKSDAMVRRHANAGNTSIKSK